MLDTSELLPSAHPLFICFYLFDCTGPSLWHAGSLVGTCRIFFPNQASNLGPLSWERGVLATGPPGSPLSAHPLMK